MKYDKTSLEIITELLKDGRETHKSLAGKLNFSRPAIHKRVENLEEDNIITGYTTEVNFQKIGFPVDVFILVNIHTNNYNKAIEEITNISSEGIYVEEVFRITGDKCIIVRVKTSSPERLRQFHDSILTLDGLIETNTMLILQSVKNDFKPEYFKTYNDD